MNEPLDASLVHNWLAGRSIARGLAAPVDDLGGWRVDTCQATEARRYVFMEASEELRELALATTDPLVALKLCGAAAALRPALSSRWRVREGGYFMTLKGDAHARRAVPSAYKAEITKRRHLTTARIFTSDGELAASGYGASVNGVFVYDRILSQPQHRRRGLGSAIMTLLANARDEPKAAQALVATNEGRLLYEKMGWVVRSPWTTALMAAPDVR